MDAHIIRCKYFKAQKFNFQTNRLKTPHLSQAVKISIRSNYGFSIEFSFFMEKPFLKNFFSGLNTNSFLSKKIFFPRYSYQKIYGCSENILINYTQCQGFCGAVN